MEVPTPGTLTRVPSSKESESTKKSFLLKKKIKRPEDYKFESKTHLPPLLSWGPERSSMFQVRNTRGRASGRGNYCSEYTSKHIHLEITFI